MSIIDQLKKALQNALEQFIKDNGQLCSERQQNVQEIRRIMVESGPTEVREALCQYVENLSTGLKTLWPFLEVNKFKNAMLGVLNAPQFSERNILKGLIAQLGEHMASHQPNQGKKNDPELLTRLERLEKVVSFQSHEVSGLQQEISRLKQENQHLTKTIALLSDKNNQLILAHQKLREEKAQVENNANQLKQAYGQLQQENAALKKRIEELTGKPSKKSETENVDDRQKLTMINPFIPIFKNSRSCKSEASEKALLLETIESDEKQVSGRSLSLRT